MHPVGDRIAEIFRNSQIPVDSFHKMIGLEHFTDRKGMIAIIQRVADIQRPRRDQSQYTGFIGKGQPIRQQFTDAVDSVDIRFVRTDTDHRHGDLDPFIHRRQIHGLVAAAGCTGGTDAVGDHTIQRFQQIHAAHIIHDLFAHQRFTDIEQCSTGESAMIFQRVTITGTLVNSESIHRQTDISGFDQCLRSKLDAVTEFPDIGVTVHVHDSRERPFAVRDVKQTGDMNPGAALVSKPGNGVAVALNFTVYFHIQRQRTIIDGADFFPDLFTQFFLESPQLRHICRSLKLRQAGKSAGFGAKQTGHRTIISRFKMKYSLSGKWRQISIPNPDIHKNLLSECDILQH